MRNSDEIVPGWAGHAVLVVTLFKQQRVVGVLTLAAVLRGRGLACPQVPGLQFLLGRDLAGPLRLSSRRDIFVLPEWGQQVPAPSPPRLSPRGSGHNCKALRQEWPCWVPPGLWFPLPSAPKRKPVFQDYCDAMLFFSFPTSETQGDFC